MPANPILLLIICLTFAGCSDFVGANEGQGAHDAVSRDGVARLAVANVDRFAPTQNAAKVSESDQIMLDAADRSCANRDYHAFIDAFIRSDAVKQKYMARHVAYTERDSSYNVVRQSRIRAQDYADFPMIMVDHYRKSAIPVRAGDQDEYVMLEISQSQSEQLALEWTRVHFDGHSEGGDDLGGAFLLSGEPYEVGGRSDGQLLFEPIGGCWHLVADTRYVSRSAIPQPD